MRALVSPPAYTTPMAPASPVFAPCAFRAKAPAPASDAMIVSFSASIDSEPLVAVNAPMPLTAATESERAVPPWPALAVASCDVPPELEQPVEPLAPACFRNRALPHICWMTASKLVPLPPIVPTDVVLLPPDGLVATPALFVAAS